MAGAGVPLPNKPCVSELQNLIDIYVRELWDVWEGDLGKEAKCARYRYMAWRFVEVPNTMGMPYIRRLLKKLEREEIWASRIVERMQDIINLENEIRQILRQYSHYILATEKVG